MRKTKVAFRLEIIISLLLIVLTIMLTLKIPFVSAANDPGHDTLYIEQQRDSELTGTLNISQQLKVANRFYSSYLEILGNGSQPTGSFPQIYASDANTLTINSLTSLYLLKDAGSMVYIGGTGVNLNISGALYFGGNNELHTSAAASASSLNLYWGDKLICNASASNCGWVSSLTGGGDITAVYTSTDLYIYNGTNTGDVYLRFNESKLNATIDARSSSSGGGWTDLGTTVNLTNPSDNVSANTLYIDNTNNRVGIGTATPQSRLDLGSNVPGVVLRIHDSGANTSKRGFGLDLSGNNYEFSQYFPDYSTGRMSFGTYNGTTYSEKMVIQANGNVGIGTASPANALEVNTTDQNGIKITSAGTARLIFSPNGGGAAAISSSVGFYFQNASYDTKMMIDTGGGSVGIGTTSPTQKLDVNGSINISSASGILYTPQICLNGDCKTNWPSGEDGNNYTQAIGFNKTGSTLQLNMNITGRGNLTTTITMNDTTRAYPVTCTGNQAIANTTATGAGNCITVQTGTETGNCSTEGSCSLITYDTELNNATIIRTITNFANTSTSDINVSGTYNSLNLQIGATGVTAASYGGATQSATITINTEGRITSASNTTITTPGDGNNYTQAIGFNKTGTTVQLNLNRTGMTNLTATFTDADTTYSAGNDIDLSGTQIDLESTLDYVGTINPVGGLLTINGNISMPTNFWIGNSATASGTNAIAIGNSPTATNTSTIAISTSANATGTGAIAIGPSTDATADYTAALGYQAQATGTYATAIGFGVVNDVVNSTKLGGKVILSGELNATSHNVTSVSCIVFDTGGKICSGA